MVAKYDFFILKGLHAWIAPRPRRPRTQHYQGNGLFTVSGKPVSRRAMCALYLL